MTVLTNVYVQTWSCSGTPSSSCALSMGGVIYVGDTVNDLSTGNHYVIESFTYDPVNDIYNSCVWQKIVTDYNIPSVLANIGISVPASQDYTNVTLDFATDRTPSSTKNTFVIANISQTSVLLGSATVNALVGGSQIASAGLSGVAATQVNSLSFIVAPTVAYQITQSTTGIGSTNTIVSIKEIYL